MTLQKVYDPNAPHNQPTDPSSIVERSYAHSVVNDALPAAEDAVGSTVMKDADRQTPNTASVIKERGADAVSYREYALTWANKDRELWLSNLLQVGLEMKPRVGFPWNL